MFPFAQIESQNIATAPPTQLQMAKTWLITGCTSGFGEEFVHQLTAQGQQVIATGWGAETRLAHLKATGAAILDLDVTSPQAVIERKFQEAWDIYGTIDVLVNNAGYIFCGALEEIKYVHLTSFRTAAEAYIRLRTEVSRSCRRLLTPWCMVPSISRARHFQSSARGVQAGFFTWALSRDSLVNQARLRTARQSLPLKVFSHHHVDGSEYIH
jgi:NAD(P)-dependent dehydrogenase (short-subunit alcohol dehydrogenase family)